MGGGAAGGSCGLNGRSVRRHYFSVRSILYSNKDFYSAADCPDYRITSVVDCLTPLSQGGKAPILFLAMEIYISQILLAAQIKYVNIIS